MKNKEFWIAAGHRAARTFCQVIVAGIGPAVALEEVNWTYVISSAALATIISLAMSVVTGLPEVKGE